MQLFILSLFYLSYELIINNLFFIFLPPFFGISIVLFVISINSSNYILFMLLIFINNIIETTNYLPLFLISSIFILLVIIMKTVFNQQQIYRYSGIYSILILAYFIFYIFGKLFFESTNSDLRVISLEFLMIHYFLADLFMLIISKNFFEKKLKESCIK